MQAVGLLEGAHKHLLRVLVRGVAKGLCPEHSFEACDEPVEQLPGERSRSRDSLMSVESGGGVLEYGDVLRGKSLLLALLHARHHGLPLATVLDD